MKKLTSVIATGFMTMVSAAWAANPPASLVMIPPQINYQGRLVTPTNSPYADAVHIIDLSLYPTASGGSNLWSERYSVQTRDGYLSVNLGSGGTGLLASNPPIWQVLWKDTSDAASPDTFFMALTVRTDQNGNPIGSPVEATPRQQFLTAPFAYRAHQSVYATKADGLFDAPQGVQTPLLTSSTNDPKGTPVLADMTITNLNLTIGSLRKMTIASVDTMAISGKSLGFAWTATSSNLMVNSKPMFVMTEGSGTTTGGVNMAVESGILNADYDIIVVGFAAYVSTGVKGVVVNPPYAYAMVTFSSAPPAGQTVYVRFVGIRKGLMKLQ
jgi:hypothetical protein